jgi:branched-chain amino acid aminotransferase
VIISIDGVVVPRERATVSVLDRGFLYGDGLFEILRSWDGALPHLPLHLDRLYISTQELRMQVIERGALQSQVEQTLVAAGGGDRRVRIVVTRGEGGIAARAASVGPGRAIVIVEELGELPREVSLATVEWPVPRRIGPAHKTLAYLDPLWARELAAAAGADEGLRLDGDGNVAECATANVFAVIGGTVVTPPLDGILPGITRARVLAACAANGVASAERVISRHELREADEIFVTSAVRGVVAVTNLDGEARAEGGLTKRLAGWINARPAI